MISHLSSIHQAHLTAANLLAESPLRTRFSERLEISRLEIDLLGRRLRSSDVAQRHGLEDVFERVHTALNSVRQELLEAVHSALGPQIPDLVPEVISEPPPGGINEEALASTASVPPPAPPPPIEIAPAPLAAEPIPAPVAIAVSEAGVADTPHQKWIRTLDLRQIQALEYLRGFEREELWEKIRTNRIIMHESAKLSGRPIDQILTAIADLMECRVNGLAGLLAGLAEKCAQSGEAGIWETWGGIHEVLRLASLAKKKSEAGPLTEVARIFHSIKFYPERSSNGRGASGTGHEVVQDLEADGYRGSTRTVIEIKSSEVPLRFNSRGPRDAEKELRFRNQARKLRAAIRAGRIAGVEYHITAPEVDKELLIYLKKTIQNKEGVTRVRIFVYRLLNDWEGLEQVVIGFDPPCEPKEDRPAATPPKASPRKWDEAAWVWVLSKYTGEGGRFKGFNDDPFNLHKVVRQPQTSKVISGLQGSLDEIISTAQQEKVRARDPEEIGRAGNKIAKAQSLKRTVAEWRKRLNTNSLSTSTICGFSFVLQEVREFLGS